MVDTNYSAQPSNSSVPGCLAENYNCVMLATVYCNVAELQCAVSPFLLVLATTALAL